MRCRVADFRLKEVINVSTGCRLGFVGDLSVDTDTGQIFALIIPGPCRFFGLFGRGDDYIIPWNAIRRIGDDIILIEIKGDYQRQKWVRA